LVERHGTTNGPGRALTGVVCALFAMALAVTGAVTLFSGFLPAANGESNFVVDQDVADTIANTAIVLAHSAQAPNPNVYLRMATKDISTTSQPVSLTLVFAAGGALYYTVTVSSDWAGDSGTSVCLVEQTQTSAFKVTRSPCTVKVTS
jgi:uncharacterized iron-regulated membrane protein